MWKAWGHSPGQASRSGRWQRLAWERMRAAHRLRRRPRRCRSRSRPLPPLLPFLLLPYLQPHPAAPLAATAALLPSSHPHLPPSYLHVHQPPRSLRPRLQLHRPPHPAPPWSVPLPQPSSASLPRLPADALVPRLPPLRRSWLPVPRAGWPPRARFRARPGREAGSRAGRARARGSACTRRLAVRGSPTTR